MTSDDLTSIDGVGPAIADELQAAGYTSVDDVHNADVDELADVHLLGDATAKAILNTEADDANTRGRDFAIDETDHDDILEAARRGQSERGCARAAGVTWAQLNRYLDAHPDFRSSFAQARAHGEADLIEGGLRDEDVDTSMAKFLLASSFDYKKTEKREVEADVTQTTTHELGEEERDLAVETLRRLQEAESE
jgi:hypothetical protein